MAKIERYFSRVAPSTQQPMANVNLGAENISRGSISVARGVASIAGVLAEEGKRIGDTARTAWLVSETTKRDAENTRLLQDAKNTVITKESDITDYINSYRARTEATRKEIAKGAYDQKGATQFSNADIKAAGEVEGLLRAIYLENLSSHADALTAQTEATLVLNGKIDELSASRDETIKTAPWKLTERFVRDTNSLMKNAFTNRINTNLASRNYSEAYADVDNEYYTPAEIEVARANVKRSIENNASIDSDIIKIDVNIEPQDKPDIVNAVYEDLKSLKFTDQNGNQVDVYDSEDKKRLSLMQKQAVIGVSTDIPFQLLQAGRTGEARSYTDYMVESNIITAERGRAMQNQITVASREAEREADEAELYKIENQSRDSLTSTEGAVVGYETATESKLTTPEYKYKSTKERADNYKAYWDMIFDGRLSFTDLADAAYRHDDNNLGLNYEDAQKLAGILTNWQNLENGVKADMIDRVNERYGEIGSSILALSERLGHNPDEVRKLKDTLDSAAEETKKRLYDYAINTPNLTKESINEEIDRILPVYMDSGMAYKKLFRDGIKFDIVKQEPTKFTFGTFSATDSQETYRFDFENALKNDLRKITGSPESIIEKMNVMALLSGQRNIETVTENGVDKYRIIGEEKLYSTFDKAQVAWVNATKGDKALQDLQRKLIDEDIAMRVDNFLHNPSLYIQAGIQINTLTPQE